MLLDCDGHVIISLHKPVMFSSRSDPVRIDAEWTDIQPAIDHITIFMQRLPETWGEKGNNLVGHQQFCENVTFLGC